MPGLDKRKVQEIKVVSIPEGATVQVASGAVILTSATHGHLPSIDWKTAANVVRVKESKSSTIARIDHILKKAADVECLRSGIGSRGGHIAREIGAPGPHNGHNPIKDSERFHTEAKLSDEELQAALRGNSKPFAPPEWDHNHIEGKTLSYKFEPSHIVHDPLFKEEIKYFKSPEQAQKLASRIEYFYQHRAVADPSPLQLGTSVSTASGSNDGLEGRQSMLSPQRHDSASAPSSSSPKRSLAPLKNPNVLSSSLCTSTDGNFDYPLEAQRPVTLSKRADEVATIWHRHVLHLRGIATNGISYKDLLDISVMREPPTFVEALVGYIAILLGLPPTWKACKRSLFKELLALQTFLREIEPLTVPVKRLRKATTLKRALMPDLTLATSESVCRSKCFANLALWVGLFNVLAEIIVAIEGKDTGLALLGGSSVASVEQSQLVVGFEDSVSLEGSAEGDDKMAIGGLSVSVLSKSRLDASIATDSQVTVHSVSVLSKSRLDASIARDSQVTVHSVRKHVENKPTRRRAFGTIRRKSDNSANSPPRARQGSSITANIDFCAFFENVGLTDDILYGLAKERRHVHDDGPPEEGVEGRDLNSVNRLKHAKVEALRVSLEDELSSGQIGERPSTATANSMQPSANSTSGNRSTERRPTAIAAILGVKQRDFSIPAPVSGESAQPNDTQAAITAAAADNNNEEEEEEEEEYGNDFYDEEGGDGEGGNAAANDAEATAAATREEELNRAAAQSVLNEEKAAAARVHALAETEARIREERSARRQEQERQAAEEQLRLEEADLVARPTQARDEREAEDRRKLEEEEEQRCIDEELEREAALERQAMKAKQLESARIAASHASTSAPADALSVATGAVDEMIRIGRSNSYRSLLSVSLMSHNGPQLSLATTFEPDGKSDRDSNQTDTPAQHSMKIVRSVIHEAMGRVSPSGSVSDLPSLCSKAEVDGGDALREHQDDDIDAWLEGELDKEKGKEKEIERASSADDNPAGLCVPSLAAPVPTSAPYSGGINAAEIQQTAAKSGDNETSEDLYDF